MSSGINEYIESVAELKTHDKKISLYSLMTIYHPFIVLKIKHKLKKKNMKNRWYFIILDYLVSKKALTKGIRNKKVFYFVNESFGEYFVDLAAAKTIEISDEKKILKKSLMLYKNTSKDFLKAMDFGKTEDKRYQNLSSLIKKRKAYNIVGIGFIIISTVFLLMQSSRFGFINMIPFYGCSLLFTIGFILYCS